MTKTQYPCPACGQLHPTPEGAECCFWNPMSGFHGQLLIDQHDRSLYRLKGWDRRLESGDPARPWEDPRLVTVEVERFSLDSEDCWGFHRSEKANPALWCRLRPCRAVDIEAKITASRKLLDLEEMLLDLLRSEEAKAAAQAAA